MQRPLLDQHPFINESGVYHYFSALLQTFNFETYYRLSQNHKQLLGILQYTDDKQVTGVQPRWFRAQCSVVIHAYPVSENIQDGRHVLETGVVFHLGSLGLLQHKPHLQGCQHPKDD